MTASSILSSDDDLIEQKETKNTTPRRLSRHASARQLFEVNEWDEQQKRLKQKSRRVISNENSSSRSSLFWTGRIEQQLFLQWNQSDYGRTSESKSLNLSPFVFFIQSNRKLSLT